MLKLIDFRYQKRNGVKFVDCMTDGAGWYPIGSAETLWGAKRIMKRHAELLGNKYTLTSTWVNDTNDSYLLTYTRITETYRRK